MDKIPLNRVNIETTKIAYAKGSFITISGRLTGDNMNKHHRV